MAISEYAATVFLPKMAKPYPSLLTFLSERFPTIARECWQRRIAEGKVLWEDGRTLADDCRYAPESRLLYFREVAEERAIPFTEKILFQNDHLLVACKPHFLPMTPTGPYVRECLLHRLRSSTGNPDLVPIHRLDRETAGVVLFSANRQTRGLYGDLFRRGRVRKSYQAVSTVALQPQASSWLVENRLVKGEPWFRTQVVPGEVNARSRVELVELRDGLGRFVLTPLTGKTHQLRVHLSGLGFPMLNDRYYPELTPERPDDFEHPLQLLADTIGFTDPVTGREMEFRTERRLKNLDRSD